MAHLAKRSAPKSISMGTLEIPPGAGLVARHHAPLEVYYLTAGEGQRLCGDKIKRVRAGDVVYLPANQVHGIRTIDDQPLELVWMFPTNTYTEIVYHEDVAFID